MDTAAKNSELYHRDFAQWAKKTSYYLSNNQLDKVDMDLVSDEILAWNIEEYVLAKQKIENILTLLLKFAYVRDDRQRCYDIWRMDIIDQRIMLSTILEANQSLMPKIKKAYAQQYGMAKVRLERDWGISFYKFPIKCPWVLKEVLAVNYVPPCENYTATSITEVEITDEGLCVALSDDRVIAIPFEWYQWLAEASDEDRSSFNIVGYAENEIIWPKLGNNFITLKEMTRCF